MGATVTCAKKIAAFRHKGEVLYVLFEETYEKNVHPHSPSWCAMVFGTISVVMEKIFAFASSCEGGMLQGRGGHITPESYIAGWMKELANPVTFAESANARIKIGAGIYMIPESYRESILEAVKNVGDVEAHEALSAGQEIYRPINSDTVVEILKTGFAPWQIDISARLCGQLADPSLGYRPMPVKTELEAEPIFRLPFPADNIFVQRGNTWVTNGWEYSYIGERVRNHWRKELECPGSYKAMIAATRKAVANASIFARTAEVVIDTTDHPDISDYQRECLRELMCVMGKQIPCCFSLGEFEAHFATDANAVYRFCCGAEIGVIKIMPPQGLSVMPVVNTEGMPQLEDIQAAADMTLEYGGVQYKLIQPLGPRKGWRVVRVCDGINFSMSARQVKSALQELALKQYQTAMEAWKSGVQHVAAHIPVCQEQAELF